MSVEVASFASSSGSVTDGEVVTDQVGGSEGTS
jgi:hypothetical protein